MKLFFSSYLFLSSVFFFAHGAWDEPPFADLPNGLEGIHYEDGIIKIQENVGENEGGGFALVQLQLTESHEIEKVSGDARFSVVKYDVEGKETWYLNVSGAFDYENLKDPQFYIALRIVGDADMQEVLVDVENVNDNWPRVVSQLPNPVPPIRELELNETTGDLIVTITAVDDDNDILTFSISEDDGDDSFRIPNNDKGEVFLTKKLNYSQKISHRLNIEITDSREPYHKTPVTVIVNVIDIPNTPPIFLRPPQIRSVAENTPTDTIITTVQAMDGDYGLRWPIEYELIDDTNLNLFKIETNQGVGVIKVAQTIDAENEALMDLGLIYSFTVVAKEIYNKAEYPDLSEEETETSEEVSFAIMDVNDQPPKICTETSQNFDTCSQEVNLEFVIKEDTIGQISLEDERIIRVIDLDSTTYFNSFTAEFDEDTEDIIKQAFTINPKRGMHPEDFLIYVNDPLAIDFENGKWHGEDGSPTPKQFTINFIGTNDSTHIARAHITATILDVNDERPVFDLPDGQSQYEFSVCENTEDGESLWHIVPTNPDYPNSCKESTKEYEIFITATDKDVTPSFGSSSIIYRWRTDAINFPPIKLDDKKGSMIMDLETGTGFDYERLRAEVFTVEAVDEEGDGLVASVPIRFTILDRNDENVDLKFENDYRGSIEENTPSNTPVLTGIKATDLDETGNIVFTLDVLNVFTKVDSNLSGDNNLSSSNYKQLEINSELTDKMKDWFDYEEVGEGTDRSKSYQIIVGTESPDREGYGVKDVDRVDLLIRVEDVNSEYGMQETTQIVTITINDTNDNPPERSEDASNFRVNVAETEWGDEGDTSSDHQREVYRLGVIDKDLNPVFHFEISSRDCELDDEIKCQEIVDMFELSTYESNAGSTILRRKKGAEIDRENRELFKDDSDILIVTVLATDQDPNHELATKFEVTVDDRNDNTPQFVEDYSLKTYNVDENVDTPREIVQILATDADHPDLYGKVSYLLTEGENSGNDNFKLGLDDGKITAIPGTFEWSVVNSFRLEVKAIDYYRPSSTSGSNINTTYIQIDVIDKNNHAPEFRTGGGSAENPFLVIGEKYDETKLATLDLRDRDNPTLPNGQITIKIDNVEKQPPSDDIDLMELFKLELSAGESPQEKKCDILSTKELEGLWGNYTITITASDGKDSDPGPLSSTRSYYLEIKNENLNPPELQYPPSSTDTSIHLSIKTAEPNTELVDLKDNKTIPNVKAVDKDAGSGPNGEVNYRFVSSPNPDCMTFFQIDAVSGMITLQQKLKEEDANKRCEMTIQAFDKGTPPESDYGTLTFILLWDENTPPQFPSVTFSVSILENSSEISSAFPRATDVDIENGNIYFPDEEIFYFLKGGASDRFQLIEESETELRLEPKEGEIIDREEVDFLQVSIYSTNDPDEQIEDRDPGDILEEKPAQWAVVNVTVLDRMDTAPKFKLLSEEGYITGGFSSSKQTDNEIGEVEAIDEDEKDTVTFEITSEFEASNEDLPNDPLRPPFQLMQAEGEFKAQIILKFDPQPYFKGHYSFNITVTDSVGYIAEAEVRIYVIASVNAINFYFSNIQEELKARQADVSAVLTEVFHYQCNVDRIFTNAAVTNATTMETHFINTTNNEPVRGDFISAQQFKPVLYRSLRDKLGEKGFTLLGIGESEPIPESNVGEIITYVLIGGVAVLIIALLILATTCFYNNRGLHRKVRALTANTFGSQQSDLNRLGVQTSGAPNTNAFAVEGSNPIWTIHSDTRKMPDFDAESLGSGGSVLIGAEDEDYFKKSSQNPMFQADDVVAEYDYENEMSYSDDDPVAPIDNYLAQNANSDTGGSPFTSRTTKNPLVTLGDNDNEMSDGVDDYGGESYQFEGNTDVGLF